MVGLPVQAGCGDEARIVVSTGMQQNEVTGKGLILHNLHYIPHLQNKKTASQHVTNLTNQLGFTFNIKQPPWVDEQEDFVELNP